MNIENLRLSKDMKYESLYWALGYEEINKGIFKKKYSKLVITIDSNNQFVDFDNKITVIGNKVLLLNNHESFVILECIDKLLNMNYLPSEIILDLDNQYDIYCKDLYIKCYEWNHMKVDNTTFKKNAFKSISYSSRLVSGIIERKTLIKEANGKIYNHGIFELDEKQNHYYLYNADSIKSKEFIIEDRVAIKYIGNSKKVSIPDGVVELAPCLFWDNQIVEEVNLPDTLISISGDTFYNASNLKKVNIPKSVKIMGNNPFAGCPNLLIENHSPHFAFIDGVLYSNDLSRLIYFPINKKEEKYSILEGCKILGKHSFYLCSNLKEITIPKTVIKFENNPFSGCNNLININNNSNNYTIFENVIYDKDFTSVIGCLTSTTTNCLVLKNVSRICRNAFWNCRGIKKLVLPKGLTSIGYNPFVGCENIEFESNSNNYIVYKGALYTSDKSKLVCYPTKYAKEEVYLPEETNTLERGAFSGCVNMTKIHLHNVSKILKACFTNCESLESVYCSDIVSYIGEWAFAHCKKLKELSIYKECYVDKNAVLNSPAHLIKRENYSNYIIESDNLFTLQSMQSTYSGKIKTILIDPPYNSHIDYIGYKDKFDDNYINFMKERIDFAYSLLSNDGFLVINIDKGEAKNLSNLCKRKFYKIKVCKWEKIHPFFDKNRSVNPKKKNVKYEYIIICFKSKYSMLNKINQPYFKKNKLKEMKRKIPNAFKLFGTNSSAKDEIKEIFEDRAYFQTPKPLKLIKELVRATSNKDSIVLDFFAGSGTTGHAVIDLNKEDDGTRKYILISNSESNICQKVTYTRISKYDDNFIFLH